MDDALRKHKLVSHEATIFTDDPVHCFFHAFLDEWACTDFPTKHLDIFALRQDVKKWLRDNYKLLHRNGIIEDWLTEYLATHSWLPVIGYTPKYGRQLHVHCSGKYLHCYCQCTHWIGGSGAFYQAMS